MQRDKSIDIAKGIGIILVVYAHVINRLELQSLSTVVNIIYSFHMPLFFVISGYCIGLKDYSSQRMPRLWDEYKKISLNLLAPYFVWSFVYMYIGGSLESAERYKAVFTLRGIAPLWFLAALALCEFVLFAVLKITRTLSIRKQIFLFAGIAAVCITAGFGLFSLREFYELSAKHNGVATYYLFVTVSRFIISMPLVLLGYITAKANILKRFKKSTSAIAGILLMSVTVFLVIISRLEVNFHLFEPDNYWIFLLCSISGSAGVLMISRSAEKLLGFLGALGQNSLAIMILHYIPFKAIEYSGKIAAFVWNNELFVSFFASALTLGVCFVGIWLVKKKFFLYK